MSSVWNGHGVAKAKMLTAVSALAVGLLTSGCYDRQELEQQAFVTSIGIDAAPKGMVDCTFVIALPVNPAAGESGGGTDATTKPLTFRAHSITEAVSLANTSIERSIRLSHVSIILFGSDEAKTGLLTQLQPLLRFREFRRTVFVGIAKGTALEVLSSNKPVLEKSPSRLADDISNVGRKSGLLSQARVHTLSVGLENNHEDSILPLYAVNKNVNSEGKKEALMTDTPKISTRAGDVVRQGGNPIEWLGAAVLSKDEMVGQLSGDEVEQLRILRGTLQNVNATYQDPLQKGKTITLSLRRERNPSYHITLSSPIKVDILVPLDADLINGEGSEDYANPDVMERLVKKLDIQVAKDTKSVLEKTIQKYHVDLIPISRHARGLFGTHQQFVDYPWMKQLEQANVTIRIDIHIRRVGVQLSPARVR